MTIEESRAILEPIRDELERRRRELAEYTAFAEREVERVAAALVDTWGLEVEKRWRRQA